MDLTEQFITKSSVDYETTPMSENETDSESESVHMNVDEEASTQPEYDVENPEN